MSEVLTDIAKTACGVVAGTVVSMVITGFMFKYFVLDKAMENKKVKRLQKSFDKAIDKLDELLEVQKNGQKNTLPEAADHEGR